jgi:MoxR-like ATPase
MKFSFSNGFFSIMLLSSLSYASHHDSKEVKPEFAADHKTNTETDTWAAIPSDDDEDEDEKAAKLGAAYAGLAAQLEKINKRHEAETTGAAAAGAGSGAAAAGAGSGIGTNQSNSEAQNDFSIGEYILHANIKTNLEKYDVGPQLSFINKFIQYLIRGDKNIQFKPLLLYGPPGTGKSTLAQVIAQASNRNIIMLPASQFVTAYQGSGSKSVQSLFAFAKEKIKADKKNLIIFIDEIDAIASDRSKEQGREAKNALIELFKEIDALTKSNNTSIHVITATNLESELDTAFKSRCRLLKIDLPDAKQRKSIFTMGLSDFKITQNSELLDYLVTETNNFSGRDLDSIILEGTSGKAPNVTLSRNDFSALITEKRDEIERNMARNTKKQRLEDIQYLLAEKQLESLTSESNNRWWQRALSVVNGVPSLAYTLKSLGFMNK